MPTYRLVHETRAAREILKTGVTLEQAERLRDVARVDPRTCLMYLVTEMEEAG